MRKRAHLKNTVIGGDPKTINPAPPKQNMHYRVYKTLATHSTPQNPIYGAELRCHTDDGKISHAGWIRREQSALFLKYIEADREIEGVIRGRPKLFKWNGEYCYRARFYWEVLPAYVV